MAFALLLEQSERQLHLMAVLAAAGVDVGTVIDPHADLLAWLEAEPPPAVDPERAELLAALGVSA